MAQIGMFDGTQQFKIDKPIRLIELFAGIGSQAKALQRLGANFEHYKLSEWEVNATASYKAIHKPNDNTDYSKDFSSDQLTKILFEIGISNDGKTPMSEKEISRKGEQWKRFTYNNFKATNNLGSILNIKGKDLEIVDIDKYNYIMSYSFPCQDLSVAGQQKGMQKGSGTRSGLLWEVERLLDECDELPQVLLMENVPQVHSEDNIGDFNAWLRKLESLGYKNYYKDLNSKDFGVPQNRNRTFCVSVLGDYYYEFPQAIPLKLKLKDLLEEKVDEKYYISEKATEKLITCSQFVNVERERERQVTQLGQVDGRALTDTVGILLSSQATKIDKAVNVANTLMARDYKGFGNQSMNGVLEIERENTMQNLRYNDGWEMG